MQMIRFVLQRIGQVAVVLLLVSAITFFLINLAPGGPGAMMKMDQSAEQREAIAKDLGLDRPVMVRYGQWLSGFLRGDLGLSTNSRQPVAPMIRQRLSNTAVLAVTALSLTIVLGVPLGIVSAVRRGSWVDHLGNLLATFGLSVPGFWFGILLIILFSVILRWLPTSGIFTPGKETDLADRLKHLIMPATVLTLTILPNIVRFARSAMLETLGTDYVRTARAKGASQFRIIYKHGLRNALIPIVTMIGLLVPALLGGSVVAESVFAWPGMGRLAVESSLNRDYTMIMGVTMVAGIVVTSTNLVLDLIYTVLDPRIRYE